MFLLDNSVVDGNYLDDIKGEIYGKIPVKAFDIKNDQIITVYPKIKQSSTTKIIEYSSSLVPVRNLKKIKSREMCIELTFVDNYREEKNTIIMTEDQKVYTTNKGYISANNLGMMDVLVNHELFTSRILEKKEVMIEGEFFDIELKYGNNIIVNNLVVLPR